MHSYKVVHEGVLAGFTVLHDVDRVIGDELRFARKALGLRQVDLAALLDVRNETVSRWETEAEEFPPSGSARSACPDLRDAPPW